MSEFYEASSQYVVTDDCAMLIPLEFGKSAEESVADAADLVARRGGRYGLLSVCAQGGMGFAMVLER